MAIYNINPSFFQQPDSAPMLSREDMLKQIGIGQQDLNPALKGQLREIMQAQRAGQGGKVERLTDIMRSTAPLSIMQQQQFQPYQQAGSDALKQVQALLGMRGDKAFNRAYQESPAMAFNREQMEKALIRNRAATGGLGDEGMQMELAKLSSGLTAQSIQDQINQLMGLTGMGYGASGQIADIMGNQANTAYNMRMNEKAMVEAERAQGQMRDLGMVSGALQLGQMAAGMPPIFGAPNTRTVVSNTVQPTGIGPTQATMTYGY